MVFFRAKFKAQGLEAQSRRKEGGRLCGTQPRRRTAEEPALGPDGGRVGGGGGGEGIYDSGGPGTYGGAQRRSRTAGGSGGGRHLRRSSAPVRRRSRTAGGSGEAEGAGGGIYDGGGPGTYGRAQRRSRTAGGLGWGRGGIYDGGGPGTTAGSAPWGGGKACDRCPRLRLSCQRLAAASEPASPTCLTRCLTRRRAASLRSLTRLLPYATADLPPSGRCGIPAPRAPLAALGDDAPASLRSLRHPSPACLARCLTRRRASLPPVAAASQPRVSRSLPYAAARPPSSGRCCIPAPHASLAALRDGAPASLRSLRHPSPACLARCLTRRRARLPPVTAASQPRVPRSLRV